MFWRLAVTLLFVLINGFFVAAEFALVKVRRARIDALAKEGSGGAVAVQRILERLDLYLSACQLGITVASLILGWLAEPAIARLIVAAANGLGWPVENGPLLHGAALAIALTVVTILHMTIGEQAPKMWAIQRPEPVAILAAHPLRLFAAVFRPLIWIINRISNAVVRRAGIDLDGEHEQSLSAQELRAVVTASAQAGHISSRQRQFTENILGFVDLEVRHILVPRTELAALSTRRSTEENLALIRETRHSRFPLHGEDPDEVLGIVHAKDILDMLGENSDPDLKAMARPPVFVPDTQPLGRLIFELQRARTHCAVVVDEHGIIMGMAFLEDAIEEIVGPIQDEFDEERPEIVELPSGELEVDGRLALPEAVIKLELDGAADDDEDTLGGYVVSPLRRLPRAGDELQIGPYSATVLEVRQHRASRLRLKRKPAGSDDA